MRRIPLEAWGGWLIICVAIAGSLTLLGCHLGTEVPQGTAPIARIAGTEYIGLGGGAVGRGKISFKGSEGAKIIWRVLPEEEELHMYELRDGSLLYMPVQQGVTSVVLVCVRDNDVDMATHTIIVSSGPEPGPGPGPGPGPQPSGDLAKLAVKLATQHITTDRVANGKKLGAAIDVVCKNYSQFGNPKEFREGIRTAAHEALDIKIFDWEPVSTGVANAINNMVQQGKITTVADYAKAWAEVASGFQNLQ